MTPDRGPIHSACSSWLWAGFKHTWRRRNASLTDCWCQRFLPQSTQHGGGVETCWGPASLPAQIKQSYFHPECVAPSEMHPTGRISTLIYSFLTQNALILKACQGGKRCPLIPFLLGLMVLSPGAHTKTVLSGQLPFIFDVSWRRWAAGVVIFVSFKSLCKKKAEKGRTRVKTMEEKLIIAGTDG